MNSQSNAVTGSAVASQTAATAAIPATRLLYWSVRRELWESRSIYLAPLAATAVYLFGFLLGTFRLPRRMAAALTLDPMSQHHFIERPYDFAALVIMGTAFVVGVFYSLDALHGERRDRSILFWKSLPVSDLTTVLAKASIPIVVLPLLSFALTVITHFIMLLVSTVVLAGNRQSVAMLWTQLPLLQMSVGLLYHLVTIHMLWYAPIYGWLLLVSGWARRLTFLWAALPPIAIGLIEKIAFNTSHFGEFMASRIGGDVAGPAFNTEDMSMNAGAHLVPGHFLSSPGLWLGLGVTAIFLWAAARLRRSQGPI
jgi:ABC-2 type transport system permease protein